MRPPTSQVFWLETGTLRYAGNIRGPISSLSWKANTTSGQFGRASTPGSAAISVSQRLSSSRSTPMVKGMGLRSSTHDDPLNTSATTQQPPHLHYTAREVKSLTPGVRRGEQRERSARCSPSPAPPCWALERAPGPLGSHLPGLSSLCPAGPPPHASGAPTTPDLRTAPPGPPGAGDRLRPLGVPPRARLASRAAGPPALTACPTGFESPRRGRQRLDGSPRHRPQRCTPRSPRAPARRCRGVG